MATYWLIPPLSRCHVSMPTFRLLGVVPLASPQSATEEEFIAGFLGLPSPADVLRADLPLVAGSAFRPGHALLLHRRARSVVLAFRGTTRLQDVLTDLTCRHAEFAFPAPCDGEGGSKVHEGFLKSAQRLAKELYPGKCINIY